MNYKEPETREILVKFNELILILRNNRDGKDKKWINKEVKSLIKKLKTSATKIPKYTVNSKIVEIEEAFKNGDVYSVNIAVVSLLNALDIAYSDYKP